MTTKEFYYWLSGYMLAVYKKGSNTTLEEALKEIDEKLKLVQVQELNAIQYDINNYPVPHPFNPLRAPATGDPIPSHPVICDPLPGDEPTIICKNDKSENS